MAQCTARNNDSKSAIAQRSATRSALRTDAAVSRGPSGARERARPFAERYVRWHLANIEIGDPVARDDIWVYAVRLAASSGVSLPKRDNFFGALRNTAGVTRLSDKRVRVVTKKGSPIKKTTAYLIQNSLIPEVTESNLDVPGSRAA